MELAALLIAVGALVLATASITLQITLFIQNKNKITQEQPRYMVEDDFLNPSEVEMTPKTKAQQTIKQADERRMQEAFDNPDVPYTGIDEEFNV